MYLVSRGASVIGEEEIGAGAPPPLMETWPWKMSVTTALFWLSGLNNQTSVRNCAPPKPMTRPATMNQPLVVEGEYAARAAEATSRKTIAETAITTCRRTMGTSLL